MFPSLRRQDRCFFPLLFLLLRTQHATMLTLAALLYALAAADVSLARTAGLHIARDAADIQQYLLQINSARFALSTMQASTDSAVCDQTSLPQDFDGSGIDPFLSRQLM